MMTQRPEAEREQTKHRGGGECTGQSGRHAACGSGQCGVALAVDNGGARSTRYVGASRQGRMHGERKSHSVLMVRSQGPQYSTVLRKR